MSRLLDWLDCVTQSHLILYLTTDNLQSRSGQLNSIIIWPFHRSTHNMQARPSLPSVTSCRVNKSDLLPEVPANYSGVLFSFIYYYIVISEIGNAGCVMLRVIPAVSRTFVIQCRTMSQALCCIMSIFVYYVGRYCSHDLVVQIIIRIQYFIQVIICFYNLIFKKKYIA